MYDYQYNLINKMKGMHILIKLVILPMKLTLDFKEVRHPRP